MGTSDGIYYILLVALIAGSGFFSATETAISTVNKIRMKNYADEGDSRAATVLKIASKYEQALSTVLIGNNIVNIASASLATVLFTKYFPANGAALSTFFMTIIVLIFGEVLPKNMAKANSEWVALRVGGILNLLMKIFAPAVFLLVKLSNFVLSRFSSEEKPSVTEEELKYIIESIEEEGVLEQDESDLVQSALEFDEIEVQEILTPRVDMIAIDTEDLWEDIVELVKTKGVSRIPVYEKSIDHIIGIVRSRDVLMAEIEGKRDIKALISDCMFVHRTMRVSQLMENMKKSKAQLAVVTDDYGGTLGLVTMEDALEELVGEIWDEYDEVEEELVRVDDMTYLVSGDANVYDTLEQIGCDMRNFESDYNTVSGRTLEKMEHIPQIGESFVYGNFRVVVEEMEDQRITKLKIEKLPGAAAAEE